MKFAEEHSCKSISIKKYYRLPISSSGRDYLINDGRNSVVKLEDQKLIHSWTLEHPHCFSSCVTYHQEEESLYCVIDDFTLLKWSLNDETLKTASKFQFQEAIFTVLPLQKRKPVVLLMSGSIVLAEFLYISLNPIGEPFVGEEELIWADAVTIHSEVKIACLTLSKDRKTHRLHEFSIKKETVTDYSSKTLEHGSHSLKDWCLNKYNFKLITIWSDGAVIGYPLQHKIASTFFTVADVEPSDLLATTVLDADHILVAKYNEHKKETILQMWDTKFTSIKAQKVLKSSSADYLQLSTVKSSIFFSTNEKLIEIPFGGERSTLATALGKSTEVSSKAEYSWKGSITANLNPKSEKAENVLPNMKMEVDETSADQIEILIQRFLEEGSSFKTNNQESDLFDMLRFALRLKRKRNENQSFEPDAVLNAIFTASFRETALSLFVKKLNLEETMIVLETLLNFMEDKISLSSSDRPSDSQLFDWIFVIMKCHTESLLLSKDRKKLKLLQRLNSCIQENIQAYEDYVSIQNMFYMLQKKQSMLPIRHSAGKYFIDTIDL